MTWFPRGRRSRFPRDMRERMELFGRYEFDPRGSGIDGGNIYQTCVIPFLDYFKADREGFLVDLHAVISDDRGGFATYGAARLVWELYGGDALTTPAAWPLIDAGIDFKMARGLPGLSLTGYENRRRRQRQDAGG